MHSSIHNGTTHGPISYLRHAAAFAPPDPVHPPPLCCATPALVWHNILHCTVPCLAPQFYPSWCTGVHCTTAGGASEGVWVGGRFALIVGSFFVCCGLGALLRGVVQQHCPSACMLGAPFMRIAQEILLCPWLHDDGGGALPSTIVLGQQSVTTCCVRCKLGSAPRPPNAT